MKTYVIVIVVFIASISNIIIGKTKTDRLQGIWEMIYNEQGKNAYSIYKGRENLSLIYSTASKSFTWRHLDAFGFISERIYDYNKLIYDVDSIKDDGIFYVSYPQKYVENGKINAGAFFGATILFEEDDLFEMIGPTGRDSHYYRLSILPNEVLKLLEAFGDEVYLPFKVCKIVKDECTVFSAQKQPTQINLVMDDVPAIRNIDGEWIEIELLRGDDLISGWIKSSNTDMAERQ